MPSTSVFRRACERSVRHIAHELVSLVAPGESVRRADSNRAGERAHADPLLHRAITRLSKRHLSTNGGSEKLGTSHIESLRFFRGTEQLEIERRSSMVELATRVVALLRRLENWSWCALYGFPPFAGAGVRGVNSDKSFVFHWHRFSARRYLDGPSVRRHQTQRPIHWGVEQLLPDRSRQNLPDKRRNGVAEHPLHFGTSRVEAETIWERLEPAHLGERQSPVVPMEGADRCPRLRLDRPRRQALCELEEKTPVAGSPTEQCGSAPAVRVPEVIFAFGNRRQEITPFSADL
jgi:hypothetical protein